MGRILSPSEWYPTETREDVLLKRARRHSIEQENEIKDAGMEASRHESRIAAMRDKGAPEDAITFQNESFAKARPMAMSLYKTKKFNEEMTRGSMGMQYLGAIFNIAKGGNDLQAKQMWAESEHLRKEIGLAGVTLEGVTPDYVELSGMVPGKGDKFKVMNPLTGKTETITGDGVSSYTVGMHPSTDKVIWALPTGVAKTAGVGGALKDSPAMKVKVNRANTAYDNMSKMLVTAKESNVDAENFMGGGERGWIWFNQASPKVQNAVMESMRTQWEVNAVDPQSGLGPIQRVQKTVEQLEELAKRTGFGNDIARFTQYWLYLKNEQIIPVAGGEETTADAVQKEINAREPVAASDDVLF